MARKEAEEKREKQLKDHQERLREINDSLRRKKKLRLIGVLEGAKGDRGPESVFEQFIAENFPKWGEKQAFKSRRQRDPP